MKGRIIIDVHSGHVRIVQRCIKGMAYESQVEIAQPQIGCIWSREVK